MSSRGRTRVVWRALRRRGDLPPEAGHLRGEEDVRMGGRQRRDRRQFTAEFKRDAVELVRTTGRPIAEIARELGIYDSTLGNWVKQDRIDRGEREGAFKRRA